jgi:endonuclease I
MRYLFLLLFFAITTFCHGQKYTPIFPTLTGDDLLEALVREYKTNTVLSYGDARDLLYGEIDNRNDSVTCIYSGHQIFLPDGVDPSTFVFMDGDKNGINAEHVFPRSKGADFGLPLADMHHIFPCRVEVNTNRGSFPFAEIPDADTQSWYFLTTELSTAPSTNIEAYSEGIRGVEGFFEPRESRKGDIARAMFYFYTIYKAQADAADSDFFSQQLSTLCQWHEQDPVDEQEYNRTFMIAPHQDDIPNPFILDCSLVERAYCQTEDIICPALPILSNTTDHLVTEHIYYPNPFQDALSIQATGELFIQIYDVHGHLLLQKHAFDEAQLDTSFLPAGIFVLQINQHVYKLVK